MSRNAVLANTMIEDQINTNIVVRLIFPDTDKGGNIDVTIPHANATRIVFEPGISLILRYLPLTKYFGTILKLYKSPNIVIVKITRNEFNPIL